MLQQCKEIPDCIFGGLIIPLSSFARTELCFFGKKLNEYRVALKALTGYRFDNPHFYLQNIRGDLFTFQISLGNNGKHSITVWNQSGQVLLSNIQFVEENFLAPFPYHVMNQIDEITSLYSEGFVKCSDCGCKMKVREGGRVFAGVYCKDCWEGTSGQKKGSGGWAAYERTINYD